MIRVDEEIKERQPEEEESFVFVDDNLHVVSDEMKQQFL